jgi:carbonic anhydrase
MKVQVVDKGYTIEVEYESPASAKGRASTGNYINYNGTEYELQQFHFHEPAEHEINGATGVPMEVHLVHEAANGSLLVIGVLIKQGKQNDGFKKILANVGGEQNLDPVQMIPGTRNSNTLNFYTYTGSLTVPPCTPPVTWVVLKEPITFSPTQLNNYKTMSNGKYANTSRGVQTTITGETVYSNFRP